MFQRGWFVLMIDDEDTREQVQTVVQRYGVSRATALDRLDAQLLEDARWAGLVADSRAISVPQLLALRDQVPTLPLLALLANHDLPHLNALHARSIEGVLTPVAAPNIVSFVQRALITSFAADPKVALTVERLAHERRLSAREVQLIAYALGDEPRARVRRRLGITENTLKTQIKKLLRKCEETTLDSLAKNILRVSTSARSPREGPPQNPVAWLSRGGVIDAGEATARSRRQELCA